ncbi:MAG: tryptophan 7-halogenase [Holophagales bacterium]|nr:tryptophan 7-halogenase [Holophagales bacterium]
MTPARDRYDVVVLGGAFSGAATALLLRREAPELSVLVVEKSKRFDSKVGEATTEMSAMFLTRRLALWRHLESEHLPKEGLRFWFSNDEVESHHQATEAGGFVRSAVPSFQLRRDALDQHLLDEAAAAGAEVARPARVRAVEVASFRHRVEIETDDGVASVACRWVIDATGRACFLGRRLGLVEPWSEHPIASMWCRWRDVRHLDDVAARGPIEFARRAVGSRRLGTNHYLGRGYWVWFIPLANGETSIGVVFDKRLIGLAEEGDKGAAYERFLRDLAPANELLDGASMRPADFRSYSTLSYICRQYAGEGWALVGDAAAFLDPFYSPGLDHAAFSIEATVELVMSEANGHPRADLAERTAEHNAAFQRSYRRFYEAVYRDKYFYMGEADLLSAAFLLDTAQYYIFVVIPAYRIHGRFHWEPVLGPKPAFFNYHLMRLYNRRLKKLAELRRAVGEVGKRNHGRRIKAYYSLDFAPWRMAFRGLRLWLWAELDGLRLLLKRPFVRAADREATDSGGEATAANSEPG